MKELARTFVAGAAGALVVAVLIGATSSITTDGSVETAAQFISTEASGPPLAVASSHLVSGLNADHLDGMDAGAFALGANTYTRAEVDALVAAAASADSRRAFYLTDSASDGASPLFACATGFHMASLWEILDPSNLRYATDAEGDNDVFRRDDSGVGPPSGSQGWVRTGFTESGTSSDGEGNCPGTLGVWSGITAVGTTVELEENWAAPTGSGEPSVVPAPWDSSTWTCTTPHKVWCVQD